MTNVDPGDGDAGEQQAHRSQQSISRSRVGGNVFQLSGNFILLKASGFWRIAVIVVVGVVLAFLSARSLIQGPGDKGTKSTAARRAPVVAAPPAPVSPLIRAVVDTDPLDLQSEELRELYAEKQDWLIPAPRVVQGVPTPDGERVGEGFYKFVKGYNAVAVNRLFFSVTVQNLTGGAAFLRTIRVTDLRCGPALKGTHVLSGGGAGPLAPRVLLINLDSPAPDPLSFTHVPEEWLSKDGESSINTASAQPFGFTLSRGETAAFDVAVLSYKHRNCRFRLKITATLNGQNQDLTIDDDHTPLAVAGIPTPDFWEYVPSNESNIAWQRAPGADSVPTDTTRTATQPLTQTTP
ncbi:hypothetical protein [Actinomadura gamaensis]|uniref:Uncharacterized protein n=1 Tax=Actinomadura gamaensis TaxID=1763541 RepID=A0ABV9U5H8_9ACTN